MLDQIEEKIKRVSRAQECLERVEDILDNRQSQLHHLIRPIFQAAAHFGDRWTPGFDSVRIVDNNIVIGYSYRDEESNYLKIPKEVFEADDPIQAAKDWRDKTKKQKAKDDLKKRKTDLLRQLADLENKDEDNME